MSDPVLLEITDDIAVIAIANPPVNALSHSVRQGLDAAFDEIARRDDVKAAVIYGTDRTFIAGADIREFGKPPQEPFLPDLINRIEACAVPVVAALHGTALGGGLEVALGAHYRIAVPSARFGLPEVTLGILPGAGGTQRLPRLAGVEFALEAITSGRQIGAEEALAAGVIDRISDTADIREMGLSYARELIASGAQPRRTSDIAPEPVSPDVFEQARAKLAKKARGQLAPQNCVKAVEGALSLPFAEGLANERALFQELMESDQRAALIHAFFAERQVAKVPEINGVEPRAISRIGVIGGGTMGAGIAVSALLAGLQVTLIERDAEAVSRAETNVAKILQGSVKRGKLTQEKFDAIMREAFEASAEYATLATADVVIEAVFESMEVKKEVFTKLDAICKPGAVLASNTSYLDVNEIAAMTTRPQDVIGLHFFSPAHVMRLLEIVVADETAPDVTATGFALAKRLKKVAVRAGVCDGFIGNRILSHYRKAGDGAVLAGASPFEVDRALVNFGLAMGPYAVSDLAGLDIGWATRKRLAPTRDPREVYAEFVDRLCEAGHLGRKTGKGFYVYDDGGQTPNAEVLDHIAEERAAKGIAAREIPEQEIVDRYMAAMINEAARVVEEGIALRPLDVDVTLLNGYGFPRWRGGPMQYADTVGLEKVLADIERFAQEDDFLWQPAPLLKRLVAEGKTFADLNNA
ncbi:short chain enoyl-CoA hydratase / 3-hydroxyacyl-CoA dehydrogenase [Ruegeria sp. TM1040]|uniref:3-hydroxyacyl-CoA dehydrogenase NAD-binding domain-containing protein n=1 Tax=Ruegeria sp. (strain TM1040) TaxID=292414 RepID=UPI0000462858|nr:3-hydroxyacyl-CoA dehydrogenase NAD-binding domain-containing protein [Ruegeria sp. TM1040]ABF63093.1 short chain enoyl-CoA hydratase / 3-hydroxyacyl-CoA dehydrogenase [Ruegeria sp. TM1040]